VSAIVSWSQKLRISVAAVLWFVLTVLFILGIAVLLAWPWWVIGAILLATLIVALPFFALRHFWQRGAPNYSAWRTYATTALATFMTLVVAAALPVYYSAYIVDAHPGAMPLTTLTDGKKTVVFQGMQHIGSEGFYKSVIYDLEKALTDGYTLYYEGVKPSPEQPELQAWFNQLATGGKDLSASYKQLADFCGLQFQLNYFGVVEADSKVHPERHVTADVSYKDLKDEYDRLAAADPNFAAKLKKETEPGADTDSSMFGFVQSLLGEPTTDQKQMIGFVCRAMLNNVGKASEPDDTAKGRLILDYRNRRLAEFLDTSSDTKIYLTYGAAHLPGMLSELQKRNPDWKIVSTTWRRVMANPDRLNGDM
jgi:hypothetical protein